jgi:hypothetical protein
MIDREYGWLKCKHCRCRIILKNNWGAISGGKFICDDKKCLDKEVKEVKKNAEKVNV